MTFNGVHWNDATPNGKWRHEPTFTTDADGIFRAHPTKDQWFVYETVFKGGFAPVFLTDIPRGKGFVVTLQNTTRLVGNIGGGRPAKVSLLLEKDKDTARAEMGNRRPNLRHIRIHQTAFVDFGSFADSHGKMGFRPIVFPLSGGLFVRETVDQRLGGLRFPASFLTPQPSQAKAINLAVHGFYLLYRGFVEKKMAGLFVRMASGLGVCLQERDRFPHRIEWPPTVIIINHREVFGHHSAYLLLETSPFGASTNSKRNQKRSRARNYSKW